MVQVLYVNSFYIKIGALSTSCKPTCTVIRYFLHNSIQPRNKVIELLNINFMYYVFFMYFNLLTDVIRITFEIGVEFNYFLSETARKIVKSIPRFRVIRGHCPGRLNSIWRTGCNSCYYKYSIEMNITGTLPPTGNLKSNLKPFPCEEHSISQSWYQHADLEKIGSLSEEKDGQFIWR
jgi:hypothetical protein